MRDWLESKYWYWWTISFDIHPLPWHWQMELTRHYNWGIRILFGPIGVMLMKPHESRKQWKTQQLETETE